MLPQCARRYPLGATLFGKKKATLTLKCKNIVFNLFALLYYRDCSAL